VRVSVLVDDHDVLCVDVSLTSWSIGQQKVWVPGQLSLSSNIIVR
jgi:hypothetical protein